MYHSIVITWIRVENIFPHTQLYIFRSYIFGFIIRPVWEIETNSWEMQKSAMFCKNWRIFYMSEALPSGLQKLQRHLMLFVSFWQVHYYDEWISSLQLDLNILGRILQEMHIHAIWELQLPVIRKTHDEECNRIFPMIKKFSTWNREQFVHYFKTEARSGACLASIFRFQALAASSTNIFDHKQELGELKPPIWRY